MGKISVISKAAVFLLKNQGKLNKMIKFKQEGNDDDRYKILYPLVDELCEKGLKWTDVKLEITGAENIPNETVVFVANHQSGIFDALIMLNLVKDRRPCGFLMKQSLKKVPLIGSWVEMLDCVFVDRENPREAVKALNAASDNLKKGISMVIFPEGTRTKIYPVLSEFKNGAFKIAQKNKTPIVPVVIFDSGARMEAADGKLTGGTIHMKVLPPVITETMDRQEYKNIAEILHGKIESEMKAFYGDRYVNTENT